MQKTGNKLKEFLKRNSHVFCALAIVAVATLVMTSFPALAADDAQSTIVELLDKMINYIGLIFVAVGVLITVYSVGQMIMAFKDDNPDAKMKAATFMIVGILLAAMPAIIKSLDLVKKVTEVNLN